MYSGDETTWKSARTTVWHDHEFWLVVLAGSIGAVLGAALMAAVAMWEVT